MLKHEGFATAQKVKLSFLGVGAMDDAILKVFKDQNDEFKKMVGKEERSQSAKEVKFKHIAFGDFLDCLRFQKLNLFFLFLKDSNLYVHYSSLNILYWSVVDIVDSAIMNLDAAMQLGPGFDNQLKTTSINCVVLK